MQGGGAVQVVALALVRRPRQAREWEKGNEMYFLFLNAAEAEEGKNIELGLLIIKRLYLVNYLENTIPTLLNPLLEEIVLLVIFCFSIAVDLNHVLKQI